MNDTELIESFKSGNADALEVLIKKYQAPLYGFIISYTKSEENAADIFQDIFLKLVENPAVFKSGNFKSWLFTVARNKCMDHFRANNGKTVSIDEEIEEGLTLESVLASDEPLPLDRMLTGAENDRLYAVFEELSPEQKEVIRLKEEFSFKEISEMLDCPLGTVLARANRGYKKMRQILEEEML